ncbi:hypothetical protein CSPB12327_08670, partial [Campylobacter sp. RM12327]|nr:hypothetical protein [Campylobacter sp. RM12327]
KFQILKILYVILITTISETRVAGVDFEKLYKKLQKAFNNLNLPKALITDKQKQSIYKI